MNEFFGRSEGWRRWGLIRLEEGGGGWGKGVLVRDPCLVLWGMREGSMTASPSLH